MNNFERVLEIVFKELDNKQYSYDYVASENQRLAKENQQLKEELETMKKAELQLDPEPNGSKTLVNYSTKEVAAQ